MFTCGGINIVISIMKNITSRPLNFILAKAYPARVKKRTCPIVVNTDTIRLFRKYLVIGIAWNTWKQFAVVIVKLESERLLSLENDTKNITKNGNNIPIAVRINIVCNKNFRLNI